MGARGGGARGLLLRLLGAGASPAAASFCTRFGGEVPAAAPAPGATQPPQARPPYGSRKAHPAGLAADEEVAARAYSSNAPAPGVDNKSFLWARYGEMKRLVQDLLPPGVCNLLNSSTIYANNEISLSTIEVYGFDYDYTLALYSSALHSQIYNTARDILVEQYKYPKDILKYEYWPNFAIRGLHYDIAKGLLMKIDAFHYIQMGTVYRGLKPVPDDEVLELYDGTHHIPLHQASGFYGKGPAIKQFMDIFSLPEMTLLAVVNDFFISNDIDYDPIHLYKDVTDAIRDVHIKGYMYKWIMQDLEKYILRGDETYAVLHRLAKSGKKLFLITNSPFSFVNKGMRYMVGKDWRDFFDVVIVQADKPHFFNDCVKPFRRLDSNGDLQWDKINKLEKGQVYKQGNLFDFLRLTGWRGSKVLYFGDHLYSDLADLMLQHGWRTGAIVPELETETKMVNTEQYSQGLTWLQALTGLLERMQMFHDPESQKVLQDWMKERQELRALTKNLFNPQFGSIFRTCHNPTYFSRRLCRFSDIYMASLSCLLNYDLNYTFYPRRTPLQHEAPLWMDQLCTGCMKTPFLEEMAHIPAARSEATSRGAEAWPATSLKGTNPVKGSQNQQQLHRELLFTHRKGLSLHSKPELLQVLEHRNRRREITEGISEQSPLEQELMRWQQRREQNQQQEATGDTAGNQPEFIRVRENLRKMEPSRDSPQHVALSLTSSPSLRSHLTKRQPLRATATHSSLVTRAKPLQLQGSSDGLPLSLAPSQRSQGNT